MNLFSINRFELKREITIFGKKFIIKRNKKLNLIKRNCFVENLDMHIKNNTRFPHPVGIVIGNHVKFGKNCIIYQNVTIGTKTNDQFDDENSFPQIGDNVVIYAGAVICGSVKIGDNAVIGANSTVLHDVEANSIYAGNPARKIATKEMNCSSVNN